MPIYIDPVTRQRIVFDKMNTDIEYTQKGDSAVTNETIPVIGNWEDYTGSGGKPSRAQQMWAGVTNELEGEDAAIDGVKVPVMNEVGDRAQTTRRRVIKKYIECKK